MQRVKFSPRAEAEVLGWCSPRDAKGDGPRWKARGLFSFVSDDVDCVSHLGELKGFEEVLVVNGEVGCFPGKFVYTNKAT